MISRTAAFSLMLLAALHAKSASADPGAPVGSPIRVVAPADGAGLIRSPGIGVDAQGNFAVVWISVDSPSGTANIRGQRYSSAGIPIGEPFTVGPAPTLRKTGDRPVSLSMSMAPDGRFVVAWQSAAITGVIHVRAFDADARPTTDDLPIVLSLQGRQRSPSAAMAANGSFAVAWAEAIETNIPTGFSAIPLIDFKRIRAQMFFADGRRNGDPINVDTAIAELAANRTENLLNHEVSEPSLAMDQYGQLAIAWRRAPTNRGGGTIVARRYDYLGTPVFDPVVIASGERGYLSAPQVGLDRYTRTLLLWQGSEQRDSAANFQRFYPTGQVNSDRTSGIGAPDALDPRIGIRPEGDFVLSFNPGNGQSSRVQFFSNQLVSRGPAAPLPGLDGRVISDCRPAAGPGTLIVVACSARTTAGEPDGIYVQRYAAE